MNSKVLDVMGPRIQLVTDLIENKDYSLMKAEVPAGVIVPVHSHDDRETFVVLTGELEAFTEDSWKTVKAGETVDIPGDVKHAWRNSSNETVTLLVVSTVKMGEFFNEIGRPVDTVPPGPPSLEVLQRFVEVAIAYGYWLGTPEDNASIGIKLG
ncbi:cupin domain-containing protein [Paenibacillus chondroitinus]|uniref:Cupin domain-containing protein n=1 Tax=Paenibacillus chondroitinus TaxID=59842 RepID=A0ABU6DIM1_9BACL|nr:MULTISPECIES: cupin domain-containing protein [Paenibacillus]MCY9662708.1 cupin domain-containing protein [Paenibacillus anseongense]MEB4796667.1 cupin domain-containing protein [Paenibacillus chondroitinus]